VSGGGTPMRCRTCGRFRAYREGDRCCVVCGSETLDAGCACGRGFDYALDEPQHGALHCPRCGRDFRGAAADWEARQG
jgi:hypothetical protein